MTAIADRPASTPVWAGELVRDHDIQKPGGERRWPWTRAAYHHASDLGFFGDLRVELLDGEILLMAGQKTPHFTSVRFTENAMNLLAGADHEVRAQGPIVLSDDSEPEPDVVVVPGTARDYADHHPTPTEIRLLIEVSDATLATDRGAKKAAYAREGISEYWIVNLGDRQLEVYRDPGPLGTVTGYKTTRILVEGETVAPLFAPERQVAVSNLLPPSSAPGTESSG